MTYILQILIFLVLITIFVVRNNLKFKTYESTIETLEKMDKDSIFPYYNDNFLGFYYQKSILKDNVFYYEKFIKN